MVYRGNICKWFITKSVWGTFSFYITVFATYICTGLKVHTALLEWSYRLRLNYFVTTWAYGYHNFCKPSPVSSPSLAIDNLFLEIEEVSLQDFNKSLNLPLLHFQEIIKLLFSPKWKIIDELIFVCRFTITNKSSWKGIVQVIVTLVMQPYKMVTLTKACQCMKLGPTLFLFFILHKAVTTFKPHFGGNTFFSFISGIAFTIASQALKNIYPPNTTVS